jgi:hypothetical protein
LLNFVLIYLKYKVNVVNKSQTGESMKNEVSSASANTTNENTNNNQTTRKPYETPILEQHGKWELATGQFGSGVVGGP